MENWLEQDGAFFCESQKQAALSLPAKVKLVENNIINLTQDSKCITIKWKI